MSSRIVDCYVCGDEFPATLKTCPFCSPRKRTQAPHIEPPDDEDDE